MSIFTDEFSYHVVLCAAITWTSDGCLTFTYFAYSQPGFISWFFTPHLCVIPVESHDRSKEEEREVEVIFQQVGEFVVAVLLLAVFQREADAAHDAETAASIEQDVLQVKGTGHQR